MTAAELTALRKRLGWSKVEMARRLDISVSRLRDYEAGKTRGPQKRSAEIPRVVELAIKYLADHPYLAFPQQQSQSDGDESS